MKGISVGAILLLALLAGCGSGSQGEKSHLTHRAFVSNAYGGSSSTSGTIQIIDTTNDNVSGTTISAGTNPGWLALSPARNVTMVYDSGDNEVSVINNKDETTSGAIQLPGATISMVAQSDSVGYAAVPKANVGSSSPLGAVVKLNLSSFGITQTIAIPSVQRIVMNSAATKLLVFSDPSSTYSACSSSTSAFVTVIDISASPATATQVCGFDHAVWGVFSSDGSTAYIMNCGPECGGTTASVQPLTMSSLTVGTAVPVSAATVGLLNGSTLYVAGSPNATQGALQGVLSVLAVGSSGTPVVSSTVAIGDGYHTQMVLASNNKLFIGVAGSATGTQMCTNTTNTSTGCLTVVNTGTNPMAVSVDAGGNSNGGVTGMAALSNRAVVYVVKNQQLQTFDTTSSSATAASTLNITGQSVDVKVVE